MSSKITDQVIETLTQNGDPWSKSLPGCFTPVKETGYSFNGLLGRAQGGLGLFSGREIFFATHEARIIQPVP